MMLCGHIWTAVLRSRYVGHNESEFSVEQKATTRGLWLITYSHIQSPHHLAGMMSDYTLCRLPAPAGLRESAVTTEGIYSSVQDRHREVGQRQRECCRPP